MGATPTPPELVTLQSPSSATITSPASVAIYGQINKIGATNIYNGQAPGIQAWVGVSSTNSNPNTWSQYQWTLANFNQESGDNDQYKANIGSELTPGTYYYVTRFQLFGTGAYQYGGTDSNGNGGNWDGVTFNSGILTVNPPLPPVNDDCLDAIPLTVGSYFSEYAVTGNNYGAVGNSAATICNMEQANSNIFYKVIVPNSGQFTVEAKTPTFYTHQLVAYSGSCGSLTEIKCGAMSITNGYPNYKSRSMIKLYNLTPGSTIYFALVQRGNYPPQPTSPEIQIAAYYNSYILGIPSNEFNSFTYFPNPVKDYLNLSNDQEIEKVEIFNLLGQNTSSTIVNAREAKIDLSHLSKGIYLVNVTSNRQTKILKVAKE